jgi:amino-acid N-acetyltransferase
VLRAAPVERPPPGGVERSRFSMMVAIDRGRPADTAAILALVARCGLPLDGLADHLERVVVARDAGRIVGTAALEVYADGALLRSVAVDGPCRGQGLGGCLTVAAIELARSLEVRTLYLLTTNAETFFPRHGFEVIGREAVPASVRASVEFTGACPATAIVMKRAIDPTRRFP